MMPLTLAVSGAAAGEIPVFLKESFGFIGSLPASANKLPPHVMPTSVLEANEYRRSWYLNHIHAAEAYALGYTGKGVTVAVVDSGIDFNHPEFVGRISPLSYSYAVGRDPLDLSDTEFDGSIGGHGTHVAGIIGAARNGRGNVGVAPDATLMVLRTNYLYNERGETPSNLGLIHAARHGAKVINGSYGPNAFPPKKIEDAAGNRISNPHWVEWPNQIIALPGLEDEYNAVKTAARNDVVMVFAAGNEYEDQPIAASHPSGIAMFPYIRPENHRKGIYSFLTGASDPTNPKTYQLADMNDPELDEVDLSDLYGTLIAVVATNSQGKISSFSNRCGVTALWCIAAPGGDRPRDGEPAVEALIPSTVPYGEYGLKAGTSMAAPVVSGGAAILREAFPYMTARQIIEVILTTATPMGSPEIYGRGMFNLGRAVRGPYEFGAEGFAQVFDVNTKGYDSVWSNDIGGTGGLIKRGEGNLVLTGNNTYAGGTDVLGGIFTLNGSLRSRLAVHGNATLRGLGRIDAPLTLAGTLEPGGASAGSIGTLTVNGDASLLKSSIYRANADGSGQHDKLDVSGQATLGGGKLEVSLVNGAAPVNKQMTLLSAGNGSLGRFGAFWTNSVSAYLTPDLEYGANDLSVTFRRNGVSVASAAQTANQASVAVAAEGLGVGNPVNDALVQNSLASTPGALDGLSGEAHGSVVAAGYSDAALVSSAVLGRLRQPLSVSPAGSVQAAYAADAPLRQVEQIHYPMFDSRVFALWGEGFGSWGRTRSDGNAGSVNTSRGGFVLGADALIGRSYRLGLAGGFTSTEIEIDSRLSSGSNESIFGAIYGSAEWGALNLRLGGSYAVHDIHMNRRISFVGFQDELISSYDGSTVQAFGEIGYRFGVGAAELEPFIGASVLRSRTDAFFENGGIAALTGASREHDLGTTTIGLRAEADLGGELPLTVKGMLGWRHAYGDVDPKALLAFSGGAATFAVSGVPVDRDAVVAEASLDWQATQALTVGLAYQGQIGERAQEHAVKGNLIWRFETR
ncbi:autotransporter domain-containing protein [Microvirga guangxiensis]|uniref:Subtilase-type serine protease n=1 Tax=Microvirga guangxiensis TaxID=549386 RepID=A0A1G5LEC1_9HYPH|nr:autotransporter serine protease [Microvirga guangxiensis]SCZ10974.1 subtilase-type serine protease [Microvirga guangxiensis]